MAVPSDAGNVGILEPILVSVLEYLVLVVARLCCAQSMEIRQKASCSCSSSTMLYWPEEISSLQEKAGHSCWTKSEVASHNRAKRAQSQAAATTKPANRPIQGRR